MPYLSGDFKVELHPFSRMPISSKQFECFHFKQFMPRLHFPSTKHPGSSHNSFIEVSFTKCPIPPFSLSKVPGTLASVPSSPPTLPMPSYIPMAIKRQFVSRMGIPHHGIKKPWIHNHKSP